MALPLSRPENQRYIFYGMEPSDEVPVCNPHADNFFNYTWSYKLDSDIVSPFFVVRDMNGSAVAPNLYAEWAMSLPKSSQKLEEVMKFKNKNKAVAMLVKNCKDNEGKFYANKLREALKVHAEELDVFGCKRDYPLAGSGAVIAREYYYVLVMAGKAHDYVTDKVLKAYWNNAVPIIRARADLTKFLPPGSYINAHFHTPEQIAAIVHYSINNPSVYRSFFKWRNFYTFHKREEFDGICEICSILNGRALFYSNSSAHLREWWESSRISRIKCA
ncbi:alpha-(1,3)-fucosyltransferase C-like [Cydia fagiglandana]|uniref:alpha-(1,3)-fucosyltransferase C-like n=1 Tax=Cydia fagiglandana TaxID=1458189 RepID=UPI002FEE08F2